jgi:molybdopterin-guanine dinucleotide biosynthesis protein
MNNAGKNRRAELPNLMLVAGNGRNVGKTTLACRIITHFSEKMPVTGLKITPHFHDYDETDLVFKNEKFIILDETKYHEKDSSRMLKAGANKVFFVMAKPEFSGEAAQKILQFLTSDLVVCESGGLHEFVIPGVFLMVKRTGEELVKTHLLKYEPIIVNSDGKDFDFDIRRLRFNNNKICLKP